MRIRFREVMCLALVLASPTALAATRYVSDDFSITLRSGQSTSHKVLKSLRSGDRLELLREHENGYGRVRTQDGTEGYVLVRFLSDAPSARERLARAEQRLAELQLEPDELNQKLSKLQEEYDTLHEAHNDSQQTQSRLQEDLDRLKRISADAVNIANERDRLKQQLSELSQQIEDYKLQTLQLRNNSDKKWFISGAGVIIVGIVLGLLLPRIRARRRRDSWGSSYISIP